MNHHLNNLVSLNTSSENTLTNLKALDFIKAVIGGEIITNPANQTSILFHQPPRPHILWIGHVDTVPSQSDQVIKSTKSKLFCRGSFDMKGSIASFLTVLRENPSLKNSVGFLITTDEETGGFNGAKWLFENNHVNLNHINAAIVGEPTNLEIGINSKGLLIIGLTLTGKAAHASQPWLGISASQGLVELAHQLSKDIFSSQPKFQKDWQTSFNLGSINSGDNTTTNVIPNKAEAILDIRFINTDNPNKLVEKISSLAEKLKQQKILKDFKLEIRSFNQPEIASLENPIVKKLSLAVKEIIGTVKHSHSFGNTDGRHLSSIAPLIPIIRFGPKGGGAHSVSEWVNLNSLEQQTLILKKLFFDLQND